MSQVEKKLAEMGLKLPSVAKPVAAYVPGVKDGKYIYTAGQVPFVDGKVAYEGHVGGECSPCLLYTSQLSDIPGRPLTEISRRRRFSLLFFLYLMYSNAGRAMPRPKRLPLEDFIWIV